MSDEATQHTVDQPRAGTLIRGVFGGTLMGLANLVPGISGGTMLLASGVYPQFINGVAEVSTFRFRLKTMLTLGCILGAAVAAILLLAGPVSMLVIHHRWVMYSLFIGLTLGGVPILWRMVRPLDARIIVAAFIGISAMAVMALVGPSDAPPAGAGSHAYAMYLVAGLAGASAMVLPGVSGGYLLLVLGQYVAILSAIALLRDGLRGGDFDEIMQSMHVIIPVGIGVVVGIVGVSNVIKLLLEKHRRATLGVLLGLLLGAVIGLWPFQHGIAPQPGEVFRGDLVTTDAEGRLIMQTTGRLIEDKDYDTAHFTPTMMQAVGSISLILAGLAISLALARLGNEKESTLNHA